MMSTSSDSPGATFNTTVKALATILGLPLTLFAIIDSVVAQPIVALIVALIMAVLASAWVVVSRWAGIIEVAISWLTLIVFVLTGFVIWPRTMTVEGYIRNTTGNALSNEPVVFFDYSGRRYETTTDPEGNYQFRDVPTGRYRIQIRGGLVEGETKGILVRVVQQNITAPERVATTSQSGMGDEPTRPPPSSATPTSNLTPPPEPISGPILTNTPTPTDTPSPQCRVVANALNLRRGPGTIYTPPITALPQGTRLEPLARDSGGGWLQVRTQDTGQVGWVTSDLTFLACTNIIIAALPLGLAPDTPTPTPTNTPTPTSTPTRTPTHTPTPTPTQAIAAEDCLPYTPANLRIEDEGASGWLLTDGRSRMLMLDNEADAEDALALARRHTAHCFIGRDNTRSNRQDYIVEYWTGKSGFNTTIDQRDCIPYLTDNLQTVNEGASGWLLTDGRSRMLILDNMQDAQSALILARRYSQQCFIGRDNSRSNRKSYIVEYWE